jgi:hypothetical protein
LEVKSGVGRVRTAVLLYLLAFVGMNVYVWVWFAIHRHGVHTFPLGERDNRFGDLLRFSGKYQVWMDPRMVDPNHLIGTLIPANYPPFAAVVYLFLLQVCAPYAMPVFVAITIGAVATACVLLWRRVRGLAGYRWYMGAAIFATGFFGWGTEQALMRGNIEGVMWIPVCLGAALYARRRYGGAGAAFGVACCIKPFPALWFAILARHRRYREVVLGVVTAALLTLASLLVIDRNPLRAYRRIKGPDTFFVSYVAAFRPMGEMIGDHSLFQSIKTIARIVRNRGLQFQAAEFMFHPNDPLAWKLYHVYLPVAAVLGLATLWKVWNMPVLNQVFALACVSNTLSYVSADYSLMLLLVPMGFFLIFLLEDVATGRAPTSLGRLLWFLLPCASIMATEPLWKLHGVLKCLALLLLWGASVSISLPSTLLDET